MSDEHPEINELHRICGPHAEAVNAYLRKRGQIKINEDYHAMTPEFRHRLLRNPAGFLRIVLATFQPQPEEVKPCAQTHHKEAVSAKALPSESTSETADITCASNAAPQGSEPPAGAAGEECPHCQASLGIHRCRDEASGLEYCSPTCALRGPSTPPPPPPGGTPEVDIRERSDNDELRPSKVVSASFARTLERQRNEARAALAAALAEVEAAREAYTSTQQSTLARLNAIARAFGWQPQTKNEDPELDDLRAELEQTRRELAQYQAQNGALSRTLADAMKDLEAHSQALTAAEQRADGAEKERAKLGDVLEKWFPDITSPHAFPIERAIYLLRLHKLAKGDIAALTAQRDTALRERDAARKDTARLDWLEGNWEQVFQRISRGGYFYFDPNEQHQKHEPTLRGAIDAALAAKTEGGV